mmetsp:Transcript_22282/g.27314  ORF Transcript_22282/g.27314 Transcript_22282/m.27314 type:complete len:214 (+) Transcript_22282:232-873(+)
MRKREQNVILKSSTSKADKNTIPNSFDIRTDELERFLQALSTSTSVSAPTPEPNASTTDAPSTTPTTEPNNAPTKAPVPSGPTVSPVDSPTRSPTLFKSDCIDDTDFWDKYEMRTCEFIDELPWRRNRYCKKRKVFNNCPRTCGKCCIDARPDQFTFDVREEARDCEWITKRIGRVNLFCDNIVDGARKIRDYCPDACGVCRDVNIQPTPAPV